MKIFLCVPFSSRVNSEGDVLPEYRKLIEGLIKDLEQLGHQIYCALVYANWRLGGDTDPDEELRHDFAKIDESDMVIALLEERVSAGVQLENGYAYAKGKDLRIYQIGSPAWSNMAFARLNGHDIKPVMHENDFAAQALKDL